MSKIKDKAIEIVLDIFPVDSPDNCFAIKSDYKSTTHNYWEIGYWNDKPLQHGKGNAILIEERVIKNYKK